MREIFDEADAARDYYGTTLAEAVEDQDECVKLRREGLELVSCLELARDELERGNAGLAMEIINKTLARWGANG